MKKTLFAIGMLAWLAVSGGTAYANSAGGQVTCAENNAPVGGVRLILTGWANCNLFPPNGISTTDANGDYIFYLDDCVGPFTLCLDTSSLPPGATVNGDTCVVITGGSSQTINWSINCGPPDSANCATINAVQGEAITPVTVTGSGGCGGPYTFSASGLPTGLTMNTGGTISGTPTVSGTFPYTITVTDACGNVGTVNCSVTVTACPPCAPHNIQYNFNGTQIIFQSTPGGSYVWFISDGKVDGLPSNQKVVLHVSNQTITIPATGSSPQFTIPVPDAFITYDPGVNVATTTFDTVNDVWRMTFPTSGMAGNIFFGGVAFKVPAAGLPGGIKNVDWKGTFTTATAGLKVNWQWSAANYGNFTSNYNSIAPKPTDDNNASTYKNSDHAGTPEGTDSVSGKLWKTFVVGGASGGGGGNYTGSGSSTLSFAPCVCPTP
jgi:hypothetical protein